MMWAETSDGALAQAKGDLDFMLASLVVPR
jgi:hypothetical protein